MCVCDNTVQAEKRRNFFYKPGKSSTKVCIKLITIVFKTPATASEKRAKTGIATVPK